MNERHPADRVAGSATSLAPSPLPIARSGWRFLPLSAAVLALDQATKGWIERNFALFESTAVLPVLDITRLHNPGAAFSFLAGAGGWQRWFFTVLALVVSGVLTMWLRRLPASEQRSLTIGLALIIGGALGNAWDRLEHGFVIDFIHAHWGPAYFPAFNVADSAITVGAGLLLLDAFFEWRRERAAA
jgi:signal peptidase II